MNNHLTTKCLIETNVSNLSVFLCQNNICLSVAILHPTRIDYFRSQTKRWFDRPETSNQGMGDRVSTVGHVASVWLADGILPKSPTRESGPSGEELVNEQPWLAWGWWLGIFFFVQFHSKFLTLIIRCICSVVLQAWCCQMAKNAVLPASFLVNMMHLLTNLGVEPQ